MVRVGALSSARLFLFCSVFGNGESVKVVSAPRMRVRFRQP